MALYPGRLFKHGAASQLVSIRAMTLRPGGETTVPAFLPGKLNEEHSMARERWAHDVLTAKQTQPVRPQRNRDRNTRGLESKLMQPLQMSERGPSLGMGNTRTEKKSTMRSEDCIDEIMCPPEGCDLPLVREQPLSPQTECTS